MRERTKYFKENIEDNFTTAARSAAVVRMPRSLSVCVYLPVCLVTSNVYIVDEVIEVDESTKAPYLEEDLLWKMTYGGR